MAKRRINAVVSDKVFATIEDLANAQGRTMTDVLRQAVTLLKWFLEAKDRGDKIIVGRGGKSYDVEFI